jgi:nucleotide-binding universal stress UspA family protein
MRILIGYDGSEHSDAAIDDLKFAGLPADSEVMVATVADLMMSSPDLSEILARPLPNARVTSAIKTAQTFAERVTHESKETSERGMERLRGLFPGWNIRSDVMIGTPGWVLLDVANLWKADLIVTGTHGRTALKRFFLGSVSNRVVNDARTSVRIGRRREYRDVTAPPRIIVGIDGSPAAEQAVYAVGQRVWESGAEIHLVAVDDSTPSAQVTGRLPQASALIGSYMESREARVSAMLAWGSSELGNIGLTTSVVRAKGDPAEVLLRKAEELNADSIFVGTRDFTSGLQRFMLGSVSRQVVNKAQCSVEIVRAAEYDS